MKKTLAIATSLLTLFGLGTACAETLVAAHGFSPSHTNYEHALMPWFECVDKETAGEIEFKHYPSGQISGHKDSIHSLNTGLAQVSIVVPGYEGGKMPLNGMPNLPNMGSTSVKVNTAYREMMNNGSPLAEEWAGLGVTPLLSMGTPGYQVFSAGSPIDTLEKFMDIKLRASAGPQSLAAAALGAVPVTMGIGDTYIALQRGTIDALVLSLTSSLAYGFPEIVKSVSANAALATGQVVLAIDTKTLKSLPENHQNAIVECGLQIEKDISLHLDVLNEEAKKVYTDNGAVVYEFSEEELAKINAKLSTVADQFVEGLEKRGIPGQKAYDMYRAILDR